MTKPPTKQDLVGIIGNLVGISADLAAAANSPERIIRGPLALVICNPTALQKHSQSLRDYAERLRMLVDDAPVVLEAAQTHSVVVPLAGTPGEG